MIKREYLKEEKSPGTATSGNPTRKKSYNHPESSISSKVVRLDGISANWKFSEGDKHLGRRRLTVVARWPRKES